MDNLSPQFISLSTGVLFLIIFLSGYSLSWHGKPYPGFGFNLHKLVALGMVVSLSVTMIKIFQIRELDTMQITTIILASLANLSLFITGGLISAGKAIPNFINWIHKSFPYFSLISTAWMIFLLTYLR